MHIFTFHLNFSTFLFFSFYFFICYASQGRYILAQVECDTVEFVAIDTVDFDFVANVYKLVTKSNTTACCGRHCHHVQLGRFCHPNRVKFDFITSVYQPLRSCSYFYLPFCTKMRFKFQNLFNAKSKVMLLFNFNLCLKLSSRGGQSILTHLTT